MKPCAGLITSKGGENCARYIMNCPSCGKTPVGPGLSAGKKAKCPACGQIMIVPEVVQEAEDIWTQPAPEPSTPFSPQPSAGSCTELAR